MTLLIENKKMIKILSKIFVNKKNEIELERVNTDYLLEVVNQSGHRVFLDNKSKTKGTVKGISPMELLLMGLWVSSIDIVSILDKQKISPASLKMRLMVNVLKEKYPLFSKK